MDPMVNHSGRRYRVLEPVGRGSFGTVYKAELVGEGGFSKMVALKLLNADIDEMGEVASRLRDEARVLGLVRHRAIVQVDGLIRLEGRWAVVMEYVEGADLRRILADTGKMPAGPALEVAGEVASALHVTYNGLGPDGSQLRLLHRDIKPSNIQITVHGEVKVLDFGVARADFKAREAETRSLVFGSIGYMSPERLDFIDGPEGDVYALGAVLFEMLTGTRFGKTSAKESRHRARLLEGLDKAWEATAGVNEELIRLIEVMMAYEPADRPTARDVERRCAALRREIGQDIFFRDWAETIVPPVAEKSRQALSKDAALADSVLSEQVLSDGAAPVPGTLSRTRSPSGPPSQDGVSQGSSASSASARSSAGSARPPSADPVPFTPYSDFGEEVTDPRTVLASNAIHVSEELEETHTSGSSRRPLYWAAGIVSLAAVALAVWGQLTGRLVVEESQVRPPIAVDPPVEPSSQEQPTAVVDPTPSDVPTLEPIEGTDVAADVGQSPSDEPEEANDGTNDEEGEGEDEEAAETAAKPAPRPRPRRRSPPPQPSGGTVSIGGDSQFVYLVKDGKTFSAGRVPAGSYQVMMNLDGRDPFKALDIEVPEGGKVSLNCKGLPFAKCNLE